MPLKIIFMGSPDFALPALKAINEEHNVIACYSQPAKEFGRGKKIKKTAVAEYAEENYIPVYTPKSLRNKKAKEEYLKVAKNADFNVVCAYGQILPKYVLYAPKFDSINIHGSILPRWRGAAPIQRAIMAGDKKTGITIMKMDEGMDTGDMLLIQEVPILKDTTAGELHDELSKVGAELITTYLRNYENIEPKAQPEEGVTYADKIIKEDERIDFDQTAGAIHNQIRALTPHPGAYFMHDGNRIKVFDSEILEPSGGVDKLISQVKGNKAGIVLDDKLSILCGFNTIIRFNKLQRAGKKAMRSYEFLKGYDISAGDLLT